ncbi:NAD-dependent deacylase [Marinivivus vitaminiproducens]|uniref:NAD-dependent deacylase n=1 Tax=Marinivivus vitaminiproducens TaxID=3035935 RepID=UPI00279CE303|nr:NAD-dependent deacylase [Geminicoccaceae bacterium SCSIO 64248]
MDVEPARPVLVLTGAGISAESGLPSFRGADGLWEGWRLEEVATPEAFARQPETVQRFYNERRRSLLAASVAPNPAHLALARLADRWPGGVVLVTQNIDDLHERGGSASVVHMHGELLKVRCLGCQAVTLWRKDVAAVSACDACGQAGRLRPHVVWFGEMPLALDVIEAAIEACGLFIAIGTSGNVYPAAGFVDAVRRVGHAHTIEVNLDASAVTSAFDEVRRGPASVRVPELVDELLAGLP